MRWYVAVYDGGRFRGDWKKIDFGKYQYGTSDRKKAFDLAQETANKLNVTVTVSEERGSANGLTARYYEIKPLDTCDKLN